LTRPARAATGRAPAGIGREVRAHAALRRRPLLVAVWAAIAGPHGALGPGVRRAALSLALRAAPLAVAAAGGALVALRALAGPAPSLLALAALGAVAVALAHGCVRRLRRAAASVPAGVLEQLELGALLVVLALAAGQLATGVLRLGAGPFAPLAYLALALVGASSLRRVSLAVALLAVAVEVAGWRLQGAPPAALSGLIAHSALVGVFAALGRSMLGARLAIAARAERAAVSRRLRAIDARARALRVLGAGALPAEQRVARAAEASVVEVEAAVRGALEVAEVALRAHTAVLFVPSDDDRELRLFECRSASDAVSRRPLPAAEGLPGAAFRTKGPARLQGAVAATWYDDATHPGSALAVPLVDPAGRARGVLLADRLEVEPFDARDERLLSTLAAEMLRAIESERLLGDVRRARDETERFYQAIERLNRTAKTRDVFDALLEVAAGVVQVDLGAVTLVEDLQTGGVRHRLVRVAAVGQEEWSRLEGRVFDDGPGIVASAVRLDASLPAREHHAARAAVFDDQTRLDGLASLKVLPLRGPDRVLGTLVLGARRRGAYGPDAVRQLEVVALQAANAIVRARLFDETERLATTDGLTGLLNHRAFQARFDEQLAQAQRYGRPLALLLTDVDHFKKVNDTHGHPVGDEVLRAVARLLAKEARATDMVARYGGEEFVVLMPETDAAGALAVAERMRARICSAPFPTSRGPLPVTISLGVASVPRNGKEKAGLLEAADQALYASKHAGRNRVTVAPTRGGGSGVQPPPGAC